MFQASFPNITNQRTSLRFSVNGLEGHHAFREAPRALRLTGLPNSLKTSEDRLLEEDLSISNTTTFGMDRTRFYTTGQQYRGYTQRDRGRGRALGRVNSLRNEIKDGISTMLQQVFKTARLQAITKTGNNTVKSNEGYEATSSNQGKLEFLVDSAGNPSFLQQHPPECTASCTNPIMVDTSNGTVRVKNNYALTLCLPTGENVKTNAFTYQISFTTSFP